MAAKYEQRIIVVVTGSRKHECESVIRYLNTILEPKLCIINMAGHSVVRILPSDCEEKT